MIRRCISPASVIQIVLPIILHAAREYNDCHYLRNKSYSALSVRTGPMLPGGSEGSGATVWHLTQSKATQASQSKRAESRRVPARFSATIEIAEREWCPSGAFAEGENEVSESSETSSGLQRKQEPLRRLSLRRNPAGLPPASSRFPLSCWLVLCAYV